MYDNLGFNTNARRHKGHKIDFESMIVRHINAGREIAGTRENYPGASFVQDEYPGRSLRIYTYSFYQQIVEE